MTTKQKLEFARQKYDSYNRQAKEWDKELIRLETLYAKQNEVQVGDNFVQVRFGINVKLCQVFDKYVLIDSEGKVFYSHDTLQDSIDYLEVGSFVRNDEDDDDDDEDDDEDEGDEDEGDEDPEYESFSCDCHKY